MMIAVKCSNCGRVLGETVDSLKAELCCRGCKQKVPVRIVVSKVADYLPERKNRENDESR